MGYLDSWEVWLVAIIIILVLMCVWFRMRENEDETGTSSCTDTITRRVEEVSSTPGTPLEETLTYSEIDVKSSAIVVAAPVVVGRQLPKQSAGERRCQEVLERIYGRKFLTQVRIDELKNPATQRNLELDIYCPELKLACEYDGAQHDRVVPKFHPNGEADLKAQQERDALKDRLCREADIYLIRVSHKTPLSQIEDYIRYHLPENVEARQRQLTLKA